MTALTPRLFLASAALLFVPACATGPSSAPMGAASQEKVVYHLNQGNEQASDGLRNIRNHLEVNPNARIVVVTHARGVDFLMKGAEDKNNNPYNVAVETLAQQGVEFRVCEITLRNRKLTKDQFIPEAKFVPSGVAEVTKLQQREGFAYLKP
jgi:intracellular sulfur oxidation DsrE/DsrF family protein